jgi:uncharacterized protein YjbK
MEVELKFRLTAVAFEKLKIALGKMATFKGLDQQFNYFLDSQSLELERKRINFRMRRVIDSNSQATSFVTIKGKGDKGLTTFPHSRGSNHRRNQSHSGARM